MTTLRNASTVRYFEDDASRPRVAFVAVTRPPGHGLDLLVPAAGAAALYVRVGIVLHRDRPERAPNEPYWLPIA